MQLNVFLLIVSAALFSSSVCSAEKQSEPANADIEKVLSYTEAQISRLDSINKGLDEAAVDQTLELRNDLCKALSGSISKASIEQLKKTASYLDNNKHQMTAEQKSRFEALKPKTDALPVDKPFCMK